MTDTTRQALPGVPARLFTPRNLLPVAAILLVAIGAALFARDYLAGSEDDAATFATVPTDHREQLEANIQFFETRVKETKDHLSYDRLTTLYLQRLRETGDVSDAQRAEASALASLEANSEAYTGTVNLALVRIAQHDFREAEALATKARDARPTATGAYAVLGDAQMALGKYNEAGDSYRTFLELAPGFSSFARSASIAEVRGNIPLATQFWNDAIDVTKDDEPADSAWARVQLGNLLFLTGDTDGARTQFDTALEVYPEYAAAQAARARSYATEGELDKAATLYAGLVARIPQPDYVIAYGEVLEALGRKGDAEKQYALVNAIEQLYVSSGVKNDLPLVNFRLDHGAPAEMPAALVAAEAAYADRPSISAADTLAWALYRNGRLDAAAAKSQEALAQGTKDPAILFHSTAIANARGDRATAQQDARELATLNTNYSLIHRAEIASLLKSVGVSE